MNKRIIVLTIIIIIIVLNTSCTSKSKIDAPAVTFENDYTLIKEKIENYVGNLELNKNRYFKKEVELNEFSSEGGFVLGYFLDNNLQYIESIVFGEIGKILYDIYIIDNNLTFFVKTEIKYNKPIYEDDFKIVEEKTKKYVILGEELLEINEISETLNEVESASEIIEMIDIFIDSLKN